MNSSPTAPVLLPPGSARTRPLRAAGALTVTITVAVLLSFTGALGAEPAAANSRSPSQWASPIQPITVVAGFDPPAQRWRAGHRGVDLAGRGTVRAAGAGTVTFAGQIAGRGVVSVSHGRLRTTYEPVAATVTVGQSVAAGQAIGTIGVGGHCSARCLHWGLLAGEEYLDPLLLLRTTPPVLKPPNTTRATRPAERRTLPPSGSAADSAIGAAASSRAAASASAGTTVETSQGPLGALPPASRSGTLIVGGGLLVGAGTAAVGARRARRRRAR